MKIHITAGDAGSKDYDFYEEEQGLPVTYEYKVECPYRVEYYNEDTQDTEEIPDYDDDVYEGIERLVDYINDSIFDSRFNEIMKGFLNKDIHNDYSEKCNVFDVKQWLEFEESTAEIYWIIDVTTNMYPEDELGVIINDNCWAQLTDGWGEYMYFSEKYFSPIEVEYEDYDEDDEDYDGYDDTYMAPVSLEWVWKTKTQFVAKL